MVEVQPYFELFDKTYWKQSGQPILKQLDYMHQHDVKGGPSFLKWFCLHVIFASPFFHFQSSFIYHTYLIDVHLSPIYMYYMQDDNVSDDLQHLSLG
jgi:hypothetical protein